MPREHDAIAAMEGRPDGDPGCLKGGGASDVGRRRRVDRITVPEGARQHVLVEQELLLLLLAEAGLLRVRVGLGLGLGLVLGSGLGSGMALGLGLGLRLGLRLGLVSGLCSGLCSGFR